jgi:hypothetical protein
MYNDVASTGYVASKAYCVVPGSCDAHLVRTFCRDDQRDEAAP